MDLLKTYYDDALAAEAEVQRIKSEMDEAFNSGDEGKLKALEMRPALDEAIKKQIAANEKYLEARKDQQRMAELSGNPASRFAPAPNPDDQPEDKSKDKVMKRSDFGALAHSDRSAFMLSGGILED